MIKQFLFDEKSHTYTLDGKKLTGVTTILGVIAKPALIGWAANQAVEHIKSTASVNELGAYVISPEELEKARKAHMVRKNDAADIGSKVHKWIEEYVLSKINGTVEPQVDQEIAHITNRFTTWAVENNVEFLESEKRLYSEEHWYAGTVDLVFRMAGNLHIGDIKTSSGIYGREFFAQMAGYQIALEEQNMLPEEVFGRTVIRCGKDGSFEIKHSFDYQTDKKIFLSALDLYRGLGTFSTK